ncbi:MAG: carbohydrate ABC transporter permease, partial [Spirochaetes bacterium]
MANLKNKLRLPSLGMRLILEFVLLVFVIIINVPFFWMISTSFKFAPEVLAYPPKLLPSKLNFDGYKYIWTLVPFARYFINTLFVSLSIAISKIVLASLAAYSFAKIPFKGKNTVFYIFLGTMMIPMEVIIIPNYITLTIIGWLDTYWALIIPFVVGAFSIFLLR